MGIAALILGIVGLVIAWIPFCGILALIPCLVGLGLGIADIIVRIGKRETLARIAYATSRLA